MPPAVKFFLAEIAFHELIIRGSIMKICPPVLFFTMYSLPSMVPTYRLFWSSIVPRDWYSGNPRFFVYVIHGTAHFSRNFFQGAVIHILLVPQIILELCVAIIADGFGGRQTGDPFPNLVSSFLV